MHGDDHGGERSASPYRAAGSVLLGAYLLLVGWFTSRPRAVPWVSPSNMQPFATIRADLAAGWQAALEGIGGDLLLLAPVGVLLPLAAGRLHRPRLSTALRTISAGALLSLGFAALRSLSPSVVVTLDGVMLNAAGIALTHLVVFPALRRRRQARPDGTGTRIELWEPGTRGGTPRNSRVGTAP